VPRLPGISNDLEVAASCKSFKVVYRPFFHSGNTGSNPVGDANSSLAVR